MHTNTPIHPPTRTLTHTHTNTLIHVHPPNFSLFLHFNMASFFGRQKLASFAHSSQMFTYSLPLSPAFALSLPLSHALSRSHPPPPWSPSFHSIMYHLDSCARPFFVSFEAPATCFHPSFFWDRFDEAFALTAKMKLTSQTHNFTMANLN